MTLLHSPLHNPYHYSVAVICRLAVCLATVLWSVLILIEADDLGVIRYPAHALLSSFAPLRAWAVGGLVASVPAIMGQLRYYPPHWIGALAYASQMLFWTYLSFSIFANQRPIPPGAAACVLVVAVMSIYAFVANPRPRKRDDDPVL